MGISPFENFSILLLTGSQEILVLRTDHNGRECESV